MIRVRLGPCALANLTNGVECVMRKSMKADDFKWDGSCWRARVVLPSWVGLPTRISKDRTEVSQGLVDLVFAPEGRDDAPLTRGEIALLRWAVEHEGTMRAPLLASLLQIYPRLRLEYDEFLGKDFERVMPKATNTADFLPLVGLRTVNVHQVHKEGIPYVGFELGCAWDQEHGLGALLHGPRVVKVGGADTATLLWIAEADLRG